MQSEPEKDSVGYLAQWAHTGTIHSNTKIKQPFTQVLFHGIVKFMIFDNYLPDSQNMKTKLQFSVIILFLFLSINIFSQNTEKSAINCGGILVCTRQINIKIQITRVALCFPIRFQDYRMR